MLFLAFYMAFSVAWISMVVFSIAGIGHRVLWQERSFVHVQSLYHYYHLEVHTYTISSRLFLLSHHLFITFHTPVHLLFEHFTLVIHGGSDSRHRRTATSSSHGCTGSLSIGAHLTRFNPSHRGLFELNRDLPQLQHCLDTQRQPLLPSTLPDKALTKR